MCEIALIRPWNRVDLTGTKRPRAAVELLGKLSFNAKLSRGRPRRGLTSAGATCYANCVSFDHLEFDLRTVRKVLNLAPYITG